MADKVTIQDLLDAGVHFGHQTKRWNPKMKPFIFGARNGIYIFDLGTTMRYLQDACHFLYETVANGGDVLMVGTKRQAQECIREAAEATGMHYVCERWLGGTLTNNKTIRKSITRMQEIESLDEKGELASRPKKEAASLRRELYKLRRNLSGIVNMRKMPTVLFIVDIEREDIAVREAQRLKIPIVALVDTNCNPDQVDQIIPGNDDALRAIKVIVDTLAATMLAAKAEQQKRAAEEEARRAAEEEAAREQARERAAARKESEAAAAADGEPAEMLAADGDE